MTREQAKTILENAEVIKAWAEGKVIEIQCKGEDPAGWQTYWGNMANFADPSMEWRIKPEPRKPREYWLKIPPSGDLSYTGIYLCEQNPTHYEPGCKFVHVVEVIDQ